MSFEETAADLTFGTQFQFKWLTFGVDWLTVYKPISKKFNSESSGLKSTSGDVEVLKVYAGLSI